MKCHKILKCYLKRLTSLWNAFCPSKKHQQAGPTVSCSQTGLRPRPAQMLRPHSPVTLAGSRPPQLRALQRPPASQKREMWDRLSTAQYVPTRKHTAGPSHTGQVAPAVITGELGTSPLTPLNRASSLEPKMPVQKGWKDKRNTEQRVPTSQCEGTHFIFLKFSDGKGDKVGWGWRGPQVQAGNRKLEPHDL